MNILKTCCSMEIGNSFNPSWRKKRLVWMLGTSLSRGFWGKEARLAAGTLREPTQPFLLSLNSLLLSHKLSPCCWIKVLRRLKCCSGSWDGLIFRFLNWTVKALGLFWDVAKWWSALAHAIYDSVSLLAPQLPNSCLYSEQRMALKSKEMSEKPITILIPPWIFIYSFPFYSTFL